MRNLTTMCFTAPISSIAALRASSIATGLWTHRDPSLSLMTALRPPTSTPFHMKGRLQVDTVDSLALAVESGSERPEGAGIADSLGRVDTWGEGA